MIKNQSVIAGQAHRDPSQPLTAQQTAISAEAPISPGSRGLTVLSFVDVCKKVGLSRSAIYEQIAAGKFPRQIKLSIRRSGFFAHEIESWLKNKGAERNTADLTGARS
jgi:prophage regulatory protein